MKIGVEVYYLYGATGELESYDVVKDSCNNICIHATDANGKRHQFDSCEAYHAFTWAEEHGFKLETKTFDLTDMGSRTA